MIAPQTSAMRTRGFWTAAALVAICAVALWLRVSVRYGEGYLFFGNASTGHPVSDAVTFNLHALNLIEGRGFGDIIQQFRARSFVPPGHPFFLGFLYFFLGDRPLAVAWVVALMGSLLPVLAYGWVKTMFGRGPGLVAAALTAVHVPYVRIGFSLMSEPTVLFVTALALWMSARLIRRPGAGLAAATGLMFGFAALVRPSALAFFWAMAPWVLYEKSTPRPRKIRALALLLGSGLLLLGAWQVRNWVVHGRPAFVYSSISARHAWAGAHPEKGPWFYSRAIWHEVLWRDPHVPELDRIQRLESETREFIRRDRVRYFLGCLWRMHVLSEFELRPETDDEDVVARSHGRIMVLQTVGLFVLAAVGLLRAFRVRTIEEEDGSRNEVPGFVWSAAYGAGFVLAVLGTGVYGASDRYRWPLEFVFFPFAALALAGLVRAASVDLSGWWELRWTRAAACAGWLRRVRQIGLALVGLAIAVYAVGLVRAAVHPDRTVENAPVVSEQDVRNVIREVGLEDAFARQTHGWITYERVLAEQKANFGRVTTLNGSVVAWWGRVFYPDTTADGDFDSSYFVPGPEAGDFGIGRIKIKRVRGCKIGMTNIQSGEVRTFIGEIHYVTNWIARPDLRVYASIPGRFDPP